MMTYNLLNLCRENLDRGVVECFNAESTLLKVIPVQSIIGHAVAYNQVKNGFTVAKREVGSCINCTYSKCLSNRIECNKGEYNIFDLDDYCVKTHMEQYKEFKELIPNLDNIYGDERSNAINIAVLKKRVIDRARIINKYESGEYTKEQYDSRLKACDIGLNMCIDDLVKKTNDIRYLEFKVRELEEVL